MTLFNQILDAINNPEKEANPSQLSNIINTVNTLSQNSNASSSALQSAMSIVGKYTKTALKEKRQQEGDASVQNLISEFAGTNANSQILNILFSSPQLQNMIQEVENKTNLNQGTIQQVLPILVPLVLNFLKTGNNSGQSLGSNSVLSSFLDTDGDGDLDIQDALNFASKYVN